MYKRQLEAQRLRLLNEVSALEARRADARERLLEDVRRDNARQLAEGERRLEALKADIAACEERAQGARAALAEAESAYACLLYTSYLDEKSLGLIKVSVRCFVEMRWNIVKNYMEFLMVL